MSLSEFVYSLLSLSWFPLSLNSWLMIVPYGIFLVMICFAIISRLVRRY